MAGLIDAILCLTVIEALALAAYHAQTGRGIAPRSYLANIAAGFFLLLTARLAVGGASAWAMAAGLLAALFAHLTDLAMRWEKQD